MSEAGQGAVLDTAKEIIYGDRARSYGPAAESFARIASAWSSVFGWDVSPEQVPAAMVVLKLLRAQTSPEEMDHYVDIAGYAALAADTVRASTAQRSAQ